jgi:hypothetical protein
VSVVRGTKAPKGPTPVEAIRHKDKRTNRVPHVTLKSIANNPEIRDGMIREEIDRAIAKYAGQETLYDQPYEDSKRIRGLRSDDRRDPQLVDRRHRLLVQRHGLQRTTATRC